MNLSTILTRWIAWRTARKRERELIAAEKKRNAIVKAIHTRKAAHREFRPLYGDLREATNASLRASIGRSA